MAAALGAGLPGGFSLSSNLFIHNLGIEVSYLSLMNVNHEDLGDFKVGLIPVMASWRMFENTNLSIGAGFPSVRGDITDPELRDTFDNLNRSLVIGMGSGWKVLSGRNLNMHLASRSYLFYDGSWNGVSTLELLFTF